MSQRHTTVLVAFATFVGLSILTFVGWTFKRTPPAPTPASDVFERISIADFRSAYDSKEITVIDVRPIEAFVAAHVPGALHIPLSRVEGEIPYLPKGKPIVTYCTCPAEETSGQAALILARGGIKAAALAGGLDAWTGAGYPTASGVQ